MGSVAALAVLVAGCDPGEDPGVWDNGPTFLIVGRAVQQPSSPADGTAVFVQARGGSFVSIVTYGGVHRYTTLGHDAKASCAELPGSEPLYFFVKPDAKECIVEARLYADCDALDSGVGFGICGSHDSFIASSVLTVLSRDPAILDGAVAEASDARRVLEGAAPEGAVLEGAALDVAEAGSDR
jgi:hypothetical protein